MAAKQEEEELRAAAEEEIEDYEDVEDNTVVTHHYDTTPPEVVYHDHDAIDHVATAAAMAMTSGESNTTVYSDEAIKLNQTPVKSTKKKRKVQNKSKKKKKTLDFFGTGASFVEDDNTTTEATMSHSSSHGDQDVPLFSPNYGHSGPAVNVFDSDVGFALGSLFDADDFGDGPENSGASQNIDNNQQQSITNALENNNVGEESSADIGSYLLNTFFTGSTNATSLSATSTDSSVLRLSLPAVNFNFFDAVDEEVDLAQDPILQQVQRNQERHGSAASFLVDPDKPLFLSYLESILPMQPNSSSSVTATYSGDDIERQQQVDRLLGGGGTSGNERSHHYVPSSSSLQSSTKGPSPQLQPAESNETYCQVCQQHTSRVFLHDLPQSLFTHRTNATTFISGTLFPQTKEDIARFGQQIFLLLTAPTALQRLVAVFNSLWSLLCIFWKLMRLAWSVLFALLIPCAIVVVWHVVVRWLCGLMLLALQSVISKEVQASISNRLRGLGCAVEEAGWRQRVRSLLAEMLTANNILSKFARMFDFVALYCTALAPPPVLEPSCNGPDDLLDLFDSKKFDDENISSTSSNSVI